jgi:hypothetical protein
MTWGDHAGYVACSRQRWAASNTWGAHAGYDLTHVHDGSEEGITVITGRGIEAVEKLLADIRTWPGGLRQFLIDDHCDPETMELIMADEAKR